MTPMALGNVSRSLPMESRTCQQSLKDFVCLEKTPCTLNASVPTYPAILIQKDDAKAQGIRANRRQKIGYVARPALVRKRMRGHPLKGVLSR